MNIRQDNYTMNTHKRQKKNMEHEKIITVTKLFKQNGISFLETQDLHTLIKMILFANEKYYSDNSESQLTDNEYDILREYIEESNPSHPIVKQVGAPISRNKVRLPYEMWSMNKIKPDTNALQKYKSKYKSPSSYILSVKLDGVSGMYSTENGVAKLYTRGDGQVGQDVSHMIPYLNLPKYENITIRGEFIMKKTIFNTYYGSETGKKVTNARNVVSGIVNKIKINPDEYSRIDFVAYEVIHPVLSPEHQYLFLKKLDTVYAKFELCTNLSNELLSSKLLHWREQYEYNIDGVICCHNQNYERVSKNPDHAFAFKMVLTNQIAEAKVVDVLWSPSKDGYLKPRIQIEPVELQGVRIEFITGFNGNFIKEHHLGVGALVEVIRSGDVIPYIKRVIYPADKIKWPDVEFRWNDTNVDIMLINPYDNIEVKIKNITLFFKRLGVEGLSEGNVKRLYRAGHKDLKSILKMSKEDFMNIDGYQEKMTRKLFTNISESIKNATLIDIINASNVFGRGLGIKKSQTIVQNYPTVFTEDIPFETKVQKLTRIEGIAYKTANDFVSKIDEFNMFLSETNLTHKLDNIVKQTKNNTGIDSNSYQISKNKKLNLNGKKIVFTGFRDRPIEEQIMANGGVMMTSVSKNTSYVVVKSTEQSGSKIQKAKMLNIPVISIDELLSYIA
jgi:DNA ligase (NAD+)